MMFGFKQTLLCRTCMACAVCLSAVGCGNSTSSEVARIATPEEAAAAAMQIYDTNGDGKFSKEEFAKCPPLATGVARIDTNRDGFITRDELQARLRTVEDGAKLIAVAVSVTAKNKSVNAATVTLIPEPFMGSGLQSYTGTTVPGGSCQLKGATGDVPGVLVGYYSAKVVQSQLNIDQVLGCEIAADASGNHLELNLR